ncbi:hypothetical protein MFIFM68171_06319 [Madurella fahalii]|uniref:Zn(2)-C6 fungal-type domain-containing protein n=1 Tax=Madurella fahalii TaxID=1157608 RepID=A0ABQ0GEL5_9PEZI
MDQLETQVSDLRSFLGQAPPAPEVVSPHDIAYSPAGPLRASSHHSSLSAPGDNSAPQPPSPVDSRVSTTGAAKRRADDGDGEAVAKQQRSKRNRYISIAWSLISNRPRRTSHSNECKRRKIKCNGQTPCQRCGHLNLQCLYAPNCCSSFKDSDEFRQMADQVKQLQEQVDTLFNSMNALRQETLRPSLIRDRSLAPASATATPSPSSSSSFAVPSKPPLPFRVPQSFHGPTSTGFTVDVAKNTLRRMGYSGVPDIHEEGGPQPDTTSLASPAITPAIPPSTLPSPQDPIWEFDESEMLRLCKIYEEEVGTMYPVIEISPIIEHARTTAAWMDAKRKGLVPPHVRELNLLDTDTLLLKVVLCCALAVQEHANSAKAVRLYDSIQPIVDKMLMTEPADVSRIPFLALCAGYRYLSNDEILSWRVIGQVARMCLELGLHRREGLEQIADPLVRRNALHTFWSAYVLDRRWSFSTGLPFVCHDDKIDPKLPYPEDYPFMVAMIGYSKLGAKIWKLIDYFEPAVTRELKARDFEELDREIMAWYMSIPEAIRTDPLEGDVMPVPAGPSYDLQRLRLWTRLRLNQVRIWLYTPVLHSATSIVENAQLAQKVVDLAKGTIRLLTHLNNKTDLYQRSQVFYHQFLTSSIAVLFLASTHAPLQFSAKCRDEFYMALDLVKNMSSRSWVSQRLWRTIRSLKAFAPKVGLEEDSSQQRMPTGSGTAFPATQSLDGRMSGSHSPGSGPAGPSDYNAASRSGSIGMPATGLSALTPAALQMQQQAADDQSNGLRLHSEMSRIWEYIGMNCVQGMGSPVGTPADMSSGHGGLGAAGFGGDGVPMQSGGGVYQHMKDML